MTDNTSRRQGRQGRHGPSREREAESDLQPLSPQRLAQIARMLPENERAAFTISLDESLTPLYLEEFTRIVQTKQPDNRMSKGELRALIDELDQVTALAPKLKPQPRLDDLSPGQLRRLAAATSQAEADQLLDEFAKEQD